MYVHVESLSKYELCSVIVQPAALLPGSAESLTVQRNTFRCIRLWNGLVETQGTDRPSYSNCPSTISPLHTLVISKRSGEAIKSR